MHNKKLGVITGATGGLGSAVVKGILDSNYKGELILTGRSLTKLKKLYPNRSVNQVEIHLLAIGLSPREDCNNLSEFIYRRNVPLRFCIHTAGAHEWDLPYNEQIASRHSGLGLKDANQVRDFLVQANLKSRELIDRSLISLYDRDRTRVIHIGSIAGSKDSEILKLKKTWLGQNGYIESMTRLRQYCEHNGYICLEVPMVRTPLTEASFGQEIIDERSNQPTSGQVIFPGVTESEWEFKLTPKVLFEKEILPYLKKFQLI